jgi:YVTN family beta-propeller protein
VQPNSVAVIDQHPFMTYIAYGHDSLWVVNEGASVVWRIDPDVNAVEAKIPFSAEGGDFTGGIAVGEGAAWVNRSDSVVRVDPETNSATTIDVRRGWAGGIAAGEGGVLTVSSAEDTLWRIDPVREAAARTIGVGVWPLGVGVGAGSVWVANSTSGTVSRIGPARNEVTGTIEVGSTPRGVAVGEGLVWVTVS